MQRVERGRKSSNVTLLIVLGTGGFVILGGVALIVGLGILAAFSDRRQEVVLRDVTPQVPTESPSPDAFSRSELNSDAVHNKWIPDARYESQMGSFQQFDTYEIRVPHGYHLTVETDGAKTTHKWTKVVSGDSANMFSVSIDRDNPFGFVPLPSYMSGRQRSPGIPNVDMSTSELQQGNVSGLPAMTMESTFHVGSTARLDGFVIAIADGPTLIDITAYSTGADSEQTCNLLRNCAFSFRRQ